MLSCSCFPRLRGKVPAGRKGGFSLCKSQDQDRLHPPSAPSPASRGKEKPGATPPSNLSQALRGCAFLLLLPPRSGGRCPKGGRGSFSLCKSQDQERPHPPSAPRIKSGAGSSPASRGKEKPGATPPSNFSQALRGCAFLLLLPPLREGRKNQVHRVAHALRAALHGPPATRRLTARRASRVRPAPACPSRDRRNTAGNARSPRACRPPRTPSPDRPSTPARP